MVKYKAGYKYVATGVHAQVLDFPAAISWGADLAEARQALTVALVDVAEAAVESGQPLPAPDMSVSNPDMDIEEPIYLHLVASSEADGQRVRIVIDAVDEPESIRQLTSVYDGLSAVDIDGIERIALDRGWFFRARSGG